jgi:hypothetical protein
VEPLAVAGEIGRPRLQVARRSAVEGTRAASNLRSELIERSAATSLLKKPADKDDGADMVSRCAAAPRP